MKPCLTILLALAVMASCLNAKHQFTTPQMGWNSWNKFACHVNENVVRNTADRLVETGLAELGYNYVNIDDCWALTARDKDGHIQVDPAAFPSGMKSTADYVHGKSLKIGIYSDAGTLTCAGRAGSLYHEEDDVATWSSWGIDYLKYDNCHNLGIPPQDRYIRMANAMDKATRPIFFSLCEWGQDDVWSWGSKMGNSWRTTGDIKDNFDSMKSNFLTSNEHPESAGPTLGWNDPDMLEIGNGGMTTEEYKTHFALWSIAKAPLLIGCDLTTMSDDTKTILMNKELISINQDPLGVQAKCIAGCSSTDGVQVYGGALENNEFVLAAVNWSSSTVSNYKINLSSPVPKSQAYTLKEVWTGKTYQATTDYTIDSIPSHGTMTYRVTPTSTVEASNKSAFDEIVEKILDEYTF
eukprot:CAMPEP_0115023590 /NCGR_PEP_ID=MMETSP0216-20121206/32517_1 /TAXON_ID=223996 /ORGANISM="Protocruzia adherens, Strain Boccale" /LENGTH=408 /DNA_ID=CAMNT_0002397055 /DNA_START=36 /DNA_END=1262 /DNA_ORIENTATION=+